MNGALEMLRIELDPLWPGLSDAARAEASAWADVARRMLAADDKGLELVRCRQDYGGLLKRVGRGTVYRKIKAVTSKGLEGILSKAEMRRAKGGGPCETSLPPAFVAWWRGLCGMHQRRKGLSVWRSVMRDWLAAGKVIPGYGLDWRGIWLADNGGVVPSECPYSDDHRAGLHPRGWGYASLLALAPEQDAWKGAAIGVHAMQAYNPSVPHTRVGLRPMRVITMDDVTLDAFCWYPGEKKARRPVGLGVLDICTANFISWSLVPVRQREDGTSAKLDGLVRRYADAAVFCHIGIDALEGLIMLLEHGTAGMTPEEEARINGILGARPDGAPWLTVLRSSTSGSPLMRGLFRERGRGRPTHKAMIEAAWNLLHNELAMLPGPSGKDWDNAPQDQEAWEREDIALIRAGAELLAKGCPEAVETIRRARTHALPYDMLDEAVLRALNEINHRRGHAIEGWEGCGFITPMVDVGGVRVSAAAAARSLSGGDAALESALAARLAATAVPERMSPAEAWASFKGRGLRRWDAFTATRILGPELAQRVTVTGKHEFYAKNAFSGARMAFGAVCKTADGLNVFMKPDAEYDVWVNPFNPNAALVCDVPAGRFIGLAPYLRPTVHGDREDASNLAVLGVFRGEQKRRAEAAAAGKVAREEARGRLNAAALAVETDKYPSSPSGGGNADTWAEWYTGDELD